MPSQPRRSLLHVGENRTREPWEQRSRHQTTNATVQTSNKPQGIAEEYVSSKYDVSVDDEESFVYTGTLPPENTIIENIHWTSFHSQPPSSIEVTLSGQQLASADVFAQSEEVESTIDGNTVRFESESQSHIVIETNGGEEPLFLLADNQSSWGRPDDVDHHFGPGVHDIGHNYSINYSDDVYLHRDAFLKGSFHIEDDGSEYVGSITGSGTISGDKLQDATALITSDRSWWGIIEGVTLLHAPSTIIDVGGWQSNIKILDWGQSDQTFTNVRDSFIMKQGTAFSDWFFSYTNFVYSLGGSIFEFGIDSNIEYGLNTDVCRAELSPDETTDTLPAIVTSTKGDGAVMSRKKLEATTVERSNIPFLNVSHDQSATLDDGSYPPIKEIQLEAINPPTSQKTNRLNRAGPAETDDNILIENVFKGQSCVADQSDLNLTLRNIDAPQFNCDTQ
jgi:hypothetical protein